MQFGVGGLVWMKAAIVYHQVYVAYAKRGGIRVRSAGVFPGAK
jgi:hypothetical protein